VRFDNIGAASFRDDRLPAYGSQLINCYAVKRQGEEGAPGAYFIAGTTGLSVVNVFSGGAIGGMQEFGGVLYGVAGNDLVEVAPNPRVVFAGAIAGTGIVEFSWDRAGIVILRDENLYLYNSAGATPAAGTSLNPANIIGTVTNGNDVLTTFGLPAGSPQEYCSTTTELDNFTLYGVANSSKFYQSGAVDPTQINASYFATKESRPDNLVRMLANKRNLMLFGAKTIEPYYNQGIANGVTFGAYQNAMIEIGLSAKYSLVNMHGVGFFLANDKKVYTFTDITVQQVSPPWLDTLLNSFTPDVLATAIGVMYVSEGQLCYALTLPGVLTVEYTAGLWHHRTSPGEAYWLPQCSYVYNGEYYFGSSADGTVWTRNSPSAFEGSSTIPRTVITADFGPKEDRTSLKYVDIHLDPYTATGGTYLLDYSDDEGRTWSGQRTMPYPVVGQQRSIARQLGQFRRRMLRVQYDGEAPFRMQDMYIGMQSGWPRGRYQPEQAGGAPQ